MAYKLITGNNDHEDNAKEVDLFKDGQFVVYVSKDYWEYISNNWSKVQNENYTSIKKFNCSHSYTRRTSMSKVIR